MMTPSPIRYPNNIRQFRMEKNLTQQDLASMMGCSLAALSRLEMGHRCPSFKTIANLEAALQRPIRDIYPDPYDASYDPVAYRRAAFFRKRAGVS